MSLDYSVASIMTRLADWALLPKYQLERRVDIFITPFLETLIGRAFDGSAQLVVPEFPLRTLHRPGPPTDSAVGEKQADRDGKKETAHTVNVDYLFWVERAGRPPVWVFLELKTDAGSFDKDQATLYTVTRSLRMSRLRADIEFVSQQSTDGKKYERLLARLGQFDPTTEEILLAYLGPTTLEQVALDWRGNGGQQIDKFLTLSGFADLPSGAVPPEHAELWPYVRDLLRSLDGRSARPYRPPGKA